MNKIPSPLINTIQAEISILIGKAINDDNKRLTLILRSHLALENVIEWACRKRLKSDIALKKSSFSNKLKVLISLYGDEIDHRFYDCCKKINKVRNKFAHFLDEEKYIDKFFDVLNQNLPNMGTCNKDDVSKISEKVQNEIFFYKVHNTILGIVEKSHADELEEYKNQMQNWIEVYLNQLILQKTSD